MQLAQAHVLGVFHDQGVGVGDVQAGFHDGGADHDVVVAVPKTLHRLFEHLLAHLAVGNDDARLRDQLAQLAGGLFNVGDFVVDVEDLAVAEQLAADRGGDLLVLLRADVGQHGVAVLRRGGDGSHLADAGQRHLQGARNRGCGHGQHVHVRFQRLDVLLVLDAEALLLVHDDQAEVFPLHARLQ